MKKKMIYLFLVKTWYRFRADVNLVYNQKNNIPVCAISLSCYKNVFMNIDLRVKVH